MLQLMFEFFIELADFILSGNWKDIKGWREKKRKRREARKIRQQKKREARMKS